VRPHPDSVGAVHEAAAALRDLGHHVEEASPPQHAADTLELFLQVFSPQVALGIRFGETLAGRPPTDEEIEPLSLAVREVAGTLSATAYLTAVAQLQLLARSTIAFFADYDLLLTPVLASRPLLTGEIHGCGEDPLSDLRRCGTFAPYTALFNVTGQPAISIPMGFGDDGLPCAVQLVGRPLAEDTVLQAAAQLEAARPWAMHLPPVAARA
jgi:amidase